MDLGLLLLRLLFGALLFGHATQKMFGWYSGLGPDRTGALFDTWGLRPGRNLAILAAVCELAAAALLAAGLLTPLGAAIAVGTLTVAASVNAAKGIWATAGGYELALLYGAIAAVLGFTGPGRWSLDTLLGLSGLAGPLWGLAALVAGLAAAATVIGYATRNRRLQPA